MHYAIAPTALPQTDEFVLLEESLAYAPDSPELIQRFSSIKRFAGERPTPGADGPAQILVSPNWVQHAFGDTKADYRDVTALLLPDGNVWGYSDFARSLVDWPKGGFGPVSYAEATPHLTRWGKATVRGERFETVDKDTLAFLQLRAALQTDAVAAVARALWDDESRVTYHGLMQGTLGDLFNVYRERVFRHVQYFECVRWRPGMVIVNGGVQEGFELPFFMALCDGDATVLCVDPGGFTGLSDFARPTAAYFAERIISCPYALWSSSGTEALPVSKDGIVLSQYKNRNVHHLDEVQFECRSVDDLVTEYGIERVDLIKLDVEGAEPAVIDGMLRTLRGSRPQLAISIYHWPEHMWEIPARLMQLLDGYRFYLRHYSYGRWECILYCIPAELDV